MGGGGGSLGWGGSVCVRDGAMVVSCWGFVRVCRRRRPTCPRDRGRPLVRDEDEVKQEVAAHMQAEVLKLSPADEDKVEQEAAATAYVPSHRSSGVASTTREPTHTTRRTSPAVNPHLPTTSPRPPPSPFCVDACDVPSPK